MRPKLKIFHIHVSRILRVNSCSVFHKKSIREYVIRMRYSLWPLIISVTQISFVPWCNVRSATSLWLLNEEFDTWASYLQFQQAYIEKSLTNPSFIWAEPMIFTLKWAERNIFIKEDSSYSQGNISWFLWSKIDAVKISITAKCAVSCFGAYDIAWINTFFQFILG